MHDECHLFVWGEGHGAAFCTALIRVWEEKVGIDPGKALSLAARLQVAVDPSMLGAWSPAGVFAIHSVSQAVRGRKDRCMPAHGAFEAPAFAFDVIGLSTGIFVIGPVIIRRNGES